MSTIFLFGAITGIINATLQSPIVNFRTRLQVGVTNSRDLTKNINKSTFLQSWKSKNKKEKICFLFRGNVARCLSESIKVVSSLAVIQWGEQAGLNKFKKNLATQIIGTIISYPLHTVSVRMIVHKQEDISYPDLVLDKMASHKGLWLNLFGGIQVLMARKIVQDLLHSLVNMSTSYFLGVVEPSGSRTRPTDLSYMLIAFAHSTIASAIVHALAYPFGVVQTCLQAGEYDGLWECVKDLYNKQGIAGLYRGFWLDITAATIYHSLLLSISTTYQFFNH